MTIYSRFTEILHEKIQFIGRLQKATIKLFWFGTQNSLGVWKNPVSRKTAEYCRQHGKYLAKVNVGN